MENSIKYFIYSKGIHKYSSKNIKKKKKNLSSQSLFFENLRGKLEMSAGRVDFLPIKESYKIFLYVSAMNAQDEAFCLRN